MPVQIFATANCDDVVIFWRIDKPLPDCWGFAIEREEKREGGGVLRTTLDNRIGFRADNAKSGDHRPSTEWPFQRFSWADHTVDTGDKVRYRVTAVIHDGTHLTENIGERSGWTPWLVVSSDAGADVAACFNRGLVISQFMARYLEKLRVDEELATLKAALQRFKDPIGDHELPIRKFLSGVLRTDLTGSSPTRAKRSSTCLARCMNWKTRSWSASLASSDHVATWSSRTVRSLRRKVRPARKRVSAIRTRRHEKRSATRSSRSTIA